MNIRKEHCVFFGVVVFLAAFVGGCSSTGRVQSVAMLTSPTQADAQMLPAHIGTSLSENQGDFSITVDNGYLQGKTLIAAPVYLAASGRYCRTVLINSHTANEKYTACRQSDALWVLVRSIL